MIEAFSLGFMQRALLAGVFIAFAASYYGVFIVQRGMSFMGNGLAHAAFGGVALGLLLGSEPLYVAVPFTIAVAILITFVRDKTTLSSDTVIGVFFAVSMALGIVFLSRLPTFTTDAFAYLFGSILAVGELDIWTAGSMALIAALTFPLWGEWAYATFDRDAALGDRLPVKSRDYLLSVLIAITIVVSAKVVGIVLISAFIVIPAAAARLVARRFLDMTVLSIVLGIVCVAAGLAFSYVFDAPSGATIVLVQTAIFILVLALGRLFVKS